MCNSQAFKAFLKCYNSTKNFYYIGGDGVDDLFLALAAFFAIGMMVLMIKYAKFIHNQPKLEEERRHEDSVKKNFPPGDNL
jgi:hypothetical protein